ncbi:MAG: DNA alkylation repair protein [Cyanobacteria bacterium RUI128]|nr:DNA alkylation repair protein [Cyanobacteria bacterium RUI128]
MKTEEIISDLKSNSDRSFAKWVSPILQVTEGGYGEEDKLFGIRTPILRKLSKKYAEIDYTTLEDLLHNEYHEARMLSLLILMNKYKNDKYKRGYIVELYVRNADYINNWDLVDVSAPNIVGNYVFENSEKLSLLYEMSRSNHLWKQRIAIVSTQYLIKQGFYEPTVRLAEFYLTHEHHLIHKAVGWMLRELGKKDIRELYSFLDKFAPKMPRVMLRYAIERLDEIHRKHYMSVK